MTFLQPLGLLGLLSLPVILILHMLRERRRRAIVSSLDLWAWLEREVRGPRPRRLPLTLILLLQLLAALLLSAALARPQMPLPLGPQGAQRVILLLDTSSSMGAVDARPTRLGEAQARAGALLASLSGNDSAVLISLAPEARRLADSAQVGLAGVAAALTGLSPAGVGVDWTGALALASASSLPERVNRIIVFTDGAFDFPAELAASPLPGQVEWNLVGGAQDNQAVVQLAARPTASGAVQVFARLANFGDAPAQRLVTLLADGAAIDSSQATLSASGTLAYTWTLPPGVSTVQLQMGGSDVLPADDVAALGVSVAQVADVLLVSSEPAVVQRALAALPNLRLTSVTPGSYTAGEAHDLTVFAGWLPEAWPAGGVLVVDPPLNSRLLPAAGAVGVGQVPGAPDDPLFADVRFDHVTFGRAAALQAEGSRLAPALLDHNGLGLAWRGVSDATRLVVFTFDLRGTNLVRRAAFPVLIANAVTELLPPPLPESIRPAEAVGLPSTHIFPQLSLTEPDGRARSFGADRPAAFDETGQPGLYLIEGRAANGETWRSGFGVNAGSPRESDLRRRAEPAFTGGLTGGGAFVLERDPLVDLWPFLAAAALLIILLEASLAWP